MSRPFVHLRVHTEYSLVDSVVRVNNLMAAVAAAKMPAVALTDQHNLFAMVKFYKAAQQRGVLPIIGADLLLRDPEQADAPQRITLLCQNRAGYLNLANLISRGYLEGQQRGTVLLESGWLCGNTDGLLALAGPEAELGRLLLADKTRELKRTLTTWQQLFPERLYLEVRRTGRPDEEDHLHVAVQLAARNGLPLVATNDVRFLKRTDFEAHEARVCIHDGRVLDDPRRPRRYSAQQYLRTPEEMAELFSDLPEALDNSIAIAKRCNLELRLGENFLPAFPVPEGHDIASYLRAEAESGLNARLAGISDEHDQTVYRERLALELDVIVQMGFPGYFLIVADFIRWAREHDVPVGPGRGSGAGSLVAYALGITNLDPLRYDLLFERFLNPERVSMPDFDVDFCMERRDRVIEYVAERYGRDRVSQIITYGSMAARAVVRDVGRVLGHPYGYVDRIAKLIPFEIGMTLEKALEQEAELRDLYEQDEEVRALLDLAQSLEGLARNAGKHAGGVVIAPAPLPEFTPLYCEAGGGGLVTQLDKDDVEAVGLVKFDFLGLRTLTIIDWAVNIINAQRSQAGEAALDIDAIPLDDAKTYALLKRHTTTAVFQLESRGMKDLIRRLQPDSFEDIVALVALFRPGPLQSGMVDDFIARKHGKAPVVYPHPDLKPILQPTYGVILYQEQVMQIAQVLAGYTLGAADLLRRAMGKKKPEEMAKQREIFLAGAAARGVEARAATGIFDLMEHFAGYGFNKSHSAAYAMLSYQTAWLKAHYPAAFMAAVLSSDMDHTDKVVGLIDECRNMELGILSPDVNYSEYMFTVAGEETIRYGLGAIKGVGQAAVEAIVTERGNAGPFTDLANFCRRLDLQKVNRRTLEALLRAGALDSLGPNRATLMQRLPQALRLAEQHQHAQDTGQNDMFGLAVAVPHAEETDDTFSPEAPDWDETERLQGERDTLGLYLTGHPITRYERDIPHLVSGRLGDLTASASEEGNGRGARPTVTVAGLVLDIQRRGGRVSLVLDDRTGRLEATLFEDTFQQFRHLLVKDAVLVVQGRLGFDEFIGAPRLTVREVSAIEQQREKYLRHLLLRWEPSEHPDEDVVARLKELLTPHRGGGCGIVIDYRNGSASVRMKLDDNWQVRPGDALLARLETWLGADNIQYHYGPARTAPAPQAALA